MGKEQVQSGKLHRDTPGSPETSTSSEISIVG